MLLIRVIAPMGKVPLGTSMTPPPAALKSEIALLSAVRFAAAVPVVDTPLVVTTTTLQGIAGGVNVSEASGAANGVITVTAVEFRHEHVPGVPPSAVGGTVPPEPDPLEPDPVIEPLELEPAIEPLELEPEPEVPDPKPDPPELPEACPDPPDPPELLDPEPDPDPVTPEPELDPNPLEPDPAPDPAPEGPPELLEEPDAAPELLPDPVPSPTGLLVPQPVDGATSTNVTATENACL
jgi:hypothetical protein